MVLKNDFCTVKIRFDETHSLDSIHNGDYDFIYNPGDHADPELSKIFSITIHHRSYLRIALIGDYLIMEKDCAVLERDTLTVLLNDSIARLCVTDGALLLVKNLAPFGCNYHIYPIPGGYILQGEAEITMLDSELNKRWVFGGKDIFESISGKTPFTLCEHSIQLYDFNDNYYEIDFNGNLLTERLV